MTEQVFSMRQKGKVGPEIQKRRDAVACIDYKPLENSAKCDFYISNGSCRRPERFMCEEWERRNPKLVEAARATVLKEQAEQKAEQTAAQGERAADAAARAPSGKHLRVLKEDADAEAAEQAPAPKPAPKPKRAPVYKVAQNDADRHILENPELLTEQAVEELAKTGFEITVKLLGGKEVTLVPKYTEADRAELSYGDARTLVMVLQVFPGASLESIRKPKETG